MTLALAESSDWTPPLCIPNPRSGLRSTIGTGTAEQCPDGCCHGHQQQEGREEENKIFIHAELAHILHKSHKPAGGYSRLEGATIAPATRPSRTSWKCVSCTCWRSCHINKVSLTSLATMMGLFGQFILRAKQMLPTMTFRKAATARVIAILQPRAGMGEGGEQLQGIRSDGEGWIIRIPW